MRAKKLSKEDLEAFENYIQKRLYKFKNEEVVWLAFELFFTKTTWRSSDDIEQFLKYLERIESFDKLRDDIENRMFNYSYNTKDSVIEFTTNQFKDICINNFNLIDSNIINEIYKNNRLLSLLANNLDEETELTRNFFSDSTIKQYLPKFKDLKFSNQKIKLISLLYVMIFVKRFTALELTQIIDQIKIDLFINIKNHDLNTYIDQPEFKIWLYNYLLENDYIHNPSYLTNDPKKQMDVIYYTLDDLYMKEKYWIEFKKESDYEILIKKIKKNWQQKNLRQNNKLKGYNFEKISKNTKAKLSKLAKAYNCSEAIMLENIIEESFKKDVG